MNSRTNKGGAFCLVVLLCGVVVVVGRFFSSPSSSDPLQDITGDAIGSTLPPWTPGMLDIHHLRVGPSVCSFVIMPDGTTMLMDAGDVDLPRLAKDVPPIRPPVPNDSKTTAGWILDYVHAFWPHPTTIRQQRRLDFALLSHFHADHLGEAGPEREYQQDEQGNNLYQRTGLTEVLSDLPANVLVDRAYPNYDFPSDLQQWSASVANYVDFVHHVESKGATRVEQFRVGSQEQFRPMMSHSRDDTASALFSIHNIKANTEVIDAPGSNTTTTIKGQIFLEDGSWAENEMATAVVIRYGNFCYYEGADQEQHVDKDGAFDTITPVASAVAKVDVATANHHGAGTNTKYIERLDPRVVILQGPFSNQPPREAVEILTSRSPNRSEERLLLVTDIYEERLQILGSLGDKLKGKNGHVVVRVNPPGPDQTYTVYMLDADEERKVSQQFGPFRPES